MSAEVTIKPQAGCAESAKEVITTGPNTEVVLIIDESNAYAVRRKFSGTMSFHNGRTDKLIGGSRDS